MKRFLRANVMVSLEDRRHASTITTGFKWWDPPLLPASPHSAVTTVRYICIDSCNASIVSKTITWNHLTWNEWMFNNNLFVQVAYLVKILILCRYPIWILLILMLASANRTSTVALVPGRPIIPLTMITLAVTCRKKKRMSMNCRPMMILDLSSFGKSIITIMIIPIEDVAVGAPQNSFSNSRNSSTQIGDVDQHLFEWLKRLRTIRYAAQEILTDLCRLNHSFVTIIGKTTTRILHPKRVKSSVKPITNALTHFMVNTPPTTNFVNCK